MRIENLLDQGPLAYLDVDAIQRQTHERVAAGELEDTLIIFEAQSTYTAGRHTKPEDIIDTDVPVVDVDRAGSITWHGPGQLVIYPVVKLVEPVDLLAYIRAVEGAVLDVVKTRYRLPAERVEGRAGVWLRRPDQPERKICAIGLKISRGATLHGLALNIDPDFDSAFTGIVPCGIVGAGVTSLAQEGVETTLTDPVEALTDALTSRLTPILSRTAQAPSPSEAVL